MTYEHVSVLFLLASTAWLIVFVNFFDHAVTGFVGAIMLFLTGVYCKWRHERKNVS